MKQKELVIGVACGLVIGAAAGAVAALLLAPASGTETRRKLRYVRDCAADAARRKMHLGAPPPPQAEEDDGEYGAFSGA